MQFSDLILYSPCKAKYSNSMTILKKMALFLVVALLPKLSSAQDKPNIIFIFADDLGYGDVGIYGQKKIPTPNIDRMAKEGMMFTSFYAGSTVCSPSRTSLLTGLTTGHAPVRGNREVFPEGQSPLPQAAKTIATLLKMDAGYRTAAFGKWGLGFTTSEGNPNWKGFEEFFGYICQRQAHDYFPDHLWHNQERIDYPENLSADVTYSAPLIHQKALEYIKNADSKQPFFMYLPYTLPHGDVMVPHDELYFNFVKKFNEPVVPVNKRIKHPYNFTDEPYPHAAFAAMITRLDQYVGDIINTVESKGISKNTLIIFTSDNGPHNEGGGDVKFFDGNGPFRGIKRDLYEGGIREPFIAYMPSKIKPSVEHHYYALWDMFPTFLDFAGVNPKKYPSDGISIKPLLLGQTQKEKHDYLYWEFHELGGKQAIRYGKWKGVKLNVNKGNAALELYDLDKDPEEVVNIADQNPEMVQKLEEYIKNARTSDPKWPLLQNEILRD